MERRVVSKSGDTGFYDRNFVRSVDELNAAVRAEAFGEDIGQFSWTTADEHRRFQAELRVGSDSRVLEVASGSGGPALFLVRSTGCRLVGSTSTREGLKPRPRQLGKADSLRRRHFSSTTRKSRCRSRTPRIDAILCIDSMNHLFDRDAVFREWSRVLTDGGTLFR
jgi:cyclopropane fatty-acyl-phospholipid synthase-like methyltransferase